MLCSDSWILFFGVFHQILTLEERVDTSGETQEERQGKMLLHTEYSLLSLLHNQDGVVHHHGLFQVCPASTERRLGGTLRSFSVRSVFRFTGSRRPRPGRLLTPILLIVWLP